MSYFITFYGGNMKFLNKGIVITLCLCNSIICNISSLELDDCKYFDELNQDIKNYIDNNKEIDNSDNLSVNSGQSSNDTSHSDIFNSKYWRPSKTEDIDHDLQDIDHNLTNSSCNINQNNNIISNNNIIFNNNNIIPNPIGIYNSNLKYYWQMQNNIFFTGIPNVNWKHYWQMQNNFYNINQNNNIAPIDDCSINLNGKIYSLDDLCKKMEDVIDSFNDNMVSRLEKLQKINLCYELLSNMPDYYLQNGNCNTNSIQNEFNQIVNEFIEKSIILYNNIIFDEGFITKRKKQFDKLQEYLIKFLYF